MHYSSKFQLLPARFTRTLAFGFGLAILISPAARAQSTWSGLGGDANWSTGANWDVPITDGFSTGLIFTGATQLTNSNDLTSGTATGLTFNSGAGAFVLGGNDFTLGGDITNNSTSLQTINNNMATTAVRTVTLTTGGGDVTLGGVISGTGGGITTAGTGTLNLNGANTYTGATTIGASTTIKVGNAGALGSTSGSLTLSGSASNLDLNGFNVIKGNFSATTATAVVTSSTAATLTVNYQNTGNLYSGLSLTGAASLMLNGSTGTANPLGTGSIVNGTGSIGFQNQTSGIRTNNIATNLGANGTLLFNGTGRITTTTNNITIGAANSIVVNGTGNTFDFQPGTNGNITTNGAWTGSGTITLTQGFNTPTFNFSGNMTGFTGTLILNSSGTTTNRGVQYAFRDSTAGQIGAGSAVITQKLSQGSDLNNTIQWKGTGSQTVAFGDLNTTGSLAYTSTGVNALSNATPSTTATFQIGALGLTSTYGGNILNGSGTVAIEKVGNGTWTVSGTSTYTGGTTISAGKLNVGADSTANTFLGAGAVQISGGGLTLNASGIGALTGITNFTQTTGSTTFDIASLSSFDSIAGTGSFAINGGTIFLVGALTGSADQSYQIFSGFTGNTVGSFAFDTSGLTGASGFSTPTLSSSGSLTFTAVPEPHAYALLVSGLLFIAISQRRRSHKTQREF